MATEILILGQALDLDEQTGSILPSFQANNLTEPDKINSDVTHEVSAPGTQRNHQLLGLAAYGTSELTKAYGRTEATLRSNGVEIMPRALLIVKGFEGGRYQLQLVAGNKRFVEALGEKKLRELDFSRFDHTWSWEAVSQRISKAYYDQYGWSYEVFDRGKPLAWDAVPFTDCYPSLSARLIWQQMLAEAGFSASDWNSELLDRLKLPAVTVAQYSEEYREARRLVVSTGPGYQDGSSQPATNRDTVIATVPYTDGTRRPNYHLPPVAGVYELPAGPPDRPYYQPDEPVYLSVAASLVVKLFFSDVRIGKAAARLYVCVNGQAVIEGEEITVDNETPFVVRVAADRLLMGPQDRVTIQVRLRGVPNTFGNYKFGYQLFQDAFYVVDGNTLTPDKLEITVLPEVPPGGPVRLSEWLPEMSQLDFFKTLVQLAGLTVQTDDYADLLELSPSATVLANAPHAVDWTAKRDQPAPSPAEPRSVLYRFGSYGQRNYFKWAPEPTHTVGYQGGPVNKTATLGYGDGVLVVDDAVLPREYTLTTLLFAATEDSAKIPGVLSLPNFKLRIVEDPFAPAEYDLQQLKPRLVLHADTSRQLTVRGGVLPAPVGGYASEQAKAQYAQALAAYNLAAPVGAATSYFAQPQGVELDAQRYVLPVCWRGLQSMLTQTRYHREQYQLTEQDIAGLDYTVPIWDGALGEYFALSKVEEFEPGRPTVVEMARLHASFLPAPVLAEQQGREFYGGEFYTSQEAY
ncbi:hypothetical protein [Hymenobacter cellulosivorans]|uniref:Uncharacterized protein n=1 Tax=Hymenobacter cellulosivorans TaxID=2932249 RepID=A0ABY4F8R7_9BACT|nr:hypothetical protein [Hymenobacter cellulosivorans]UOQ53062.1 hypothetical protein MUN80_25410 [Hymenobacter cellulosivorans]